MKIRVKGSIVLEGRDNSGKLVKRIENYNLWTTLGRSFIANTLAATSGYSVGLTYCALGIGTTAPAVGDTTLANEVARLAVTTRTVTDNILVISTYFTIAQSTYAIKEIGIFGHSDATATANTGKLFARSLLDFDNVTSPVNITVYWTLEIG